MNDNRLRALVIIQRARLVKIQRAATHQGLQGNCAPEGVDTSAPDFNPAEHIAAYWRLHPSATGDFNGSEDQKNFAAWRHQATKN